MEITASLVRDLREASGAGMMDCKKALNACDGDLEKAMDYLRENGIAKAEKRVVVSPLKVLPKFLLKEIKLLF